MKTLDWIALILVIIGGLNWGLVGLLNYNVVSAIFGDGALANIIYDLVGLAAIWVAFMSPRYVKGGGMGGM